MTNLIRNLARFATVAAVVGLGGCVGAPYGEPVVYSQPPVQPGYAYQPPSGRQDVAYGGSCYAGVYTCAMAQALPIGSQCSCPGLGAPSFGSVR